MQNLPEEILMYCFEFLEPNQYIYICATSKAFRHIYLKVHAGNGDFITNLQGITSSHSRLQFYVNEKIHEEYPKLQTREQSKTGKLKSMMKKLKYSLPRQKKKLHQKQQTLIETFRRDLVLENKILYASLQNVGKTGDIRMLNWIYGIAVQNTFSQSQFQSKLLELPKIAVANGNLSVLKWMTSHGIDFSMQGLYTEAALRGDIETLNWLYYDQKYTNWDHNTFTWTAFHEQWTILEWLRAKGCPWERATGLYNDAVLHNNLMKIKYLRKFGCPYDNDAIIIAAKKRYWHIVDFLNRNGCPWNRAAGITSSAAISGDIESLKMLKHFCCPFDKDICTHAAKSRQWEVLEWLHEHGCRWKKFTGLTSAAAERGDIATLKLLYDFGCPYDSDTLSKAAKSGEWETLRWLTSHGCKWCKDDAEIGFTAARRGNVATLEKLLKYGLPLRTEIFDHAGEYGQWETLKWMKRQEGIRIDESHCNLAAEKGSLHWLQMLRAVGLPWSEKTSTIAAENGNATLLKWCVANGCPIDTQICFNAAASSGNLDILKWLKNTQHHTLFTAETSKQQDRAIWSWSNGSLHTNVKWMYMLLVALL